MKPTIADNVLTSLYFLLWILVFFLYHKKNRQLDGGSVIIGSYMCYALFSIITLNRPIDIIAYYDFNHLTLFPFVYLFVMLIIALTPLIRAHFVPACHIEGNSSMALYVIAIMTILSALIMLPGIVMNFSDGLLKLITDMDAGKDAYGEQLENAAESGGGISNIPAIIFNALSEISIFIFYYFMAFSTRNRWLVLGLGVSAIVAVLQPIMEGQRSLVINTLFTIIAGYFFFKKYLSDSIRKVVRWVGVVVIGLVLVPICTITISRFSNQRSTVTDYVNWYIGQGNLYFNNYALDDNGIRYGDRTFNMVKRLISPDASHNYVDRRDTYRNLYVNDDVFTTFVGDFAIDFGPIVAFLLFVVFNSWVLYATRVRKQSLKTHQLFLLYFTMCVCMQGGMTLFSFSDTANLKMICFAILYVYLAVYDIVLSKYPRKIIFVRHKSYASSGKRIIKKKGYSKPKTSQV